MEKEEKRKEARQKKKMLGTGKGWDSKGGAYVRVAPGGLAKKRTLQGGGGRPFTCEKEGYQKPLRP